MFAHGQSNASSGGRPCTERPEVAASVKRAALVAIAPAVAAMAMAVVP